LPKIYCQQGARQPGDIISYRRATSFRNQRATSSESAPYEVKDGNLHIPDVPGVGLEWDEKAVAAHLADNF
jgi:L-alanine-DL-glutamate epimerase-like enolase superfamily enzyme